MSPESKAVILLIIALAIFALLLFLGSLLRREWVKAELAQRGCRPVRIWWAPVGSMIPRGLACGPAFRVIYLDAAGRRHRAYCVTSNVGREVEWVTDVICD